MEDAENIIMSSVEMTGYRQVLDDGDISVTAAAGEQLARLVADMDDDDIEAIRIYVSGGGCGGMNYGMTFTDKRTDYDSVLSAEGYSIYVDAVALQYIGGVEIDYVERDLGATFVFNNVFQSTGGSGVCGRCGAAGGGCG